MFKRVSKEQKLLIASTFAIGFISGAYLYLTVFVTEFRDGVLPKLPEQVRDGDISVRAAQYGICLDSGLTCPSYEVSVDGRLFVEPPASPTGTAVVEEGALTRAELVTLHRLINQAPLEAYKAPSAVANCASDFSDHHRYVITMGATTHILDTCRTMFPVDSELALVLEALFVTEPVLE